MSRNTKIILAVVAGVLVVLCLCAGTIALTVSLFFINSSVTTSPVEVSRTAEEAVQVDPGQLEGAGAIADLTVPAGWQPEQSVRVGGFRLAGYRPDTGTGHIFLIVLPETAETSLEELEREAREFADRYGYTWNKTEMEVVERKTITVQGKPTEMVVAEGTGSSGRWRQAMVAFRGNQGLTLVIYGMPADSYDQETADALFASIR